MLALRETTTAFDNCKGMEMKQIVADSFGWARTTVEDGSPITEAVAHKEAGNSLFESKRYSEAAQEYMHGLSIICGSSSELFACKKAKR